MPIRPDVGRLESIASSLRSWSEDIGRINRDLYSKSSSMMWEGHAFNKYDASYKEISSNLTRTASIMKGYASTLDSLANSFRLADLEAERIERQRREREAAAAAAAAAAAKAKSNK
ncbi:WXG100 family type VII secretion target [Paenibacillus harenae]|uniref:Uncharacterized protein YukE n=1 Tax=Paenibacillus harenae TaxID=306543 RepID=A0ABT9TTK1_PAEHA|nr:WXG100 family type VII secretion target [Paenibacillus harenae]MDQ0110660.1 uncharacterized protein YukE [Paenibacillus harenae]